MNNIRRVGPLCFSLRAMQTQIVTTQKIFNPILNAITTISNKYEYTLFFIFCMDGYNWVN